MGSLAILTRADLMSRLRDLALNRLFFPPPNVFMTAANLITHFDQTIELIARRVFQEPFRAEEMNTHKVMPALQEKVVGGKRLESARARRRAKNR